MCNKESCLLLAEKEQTKLALYLLGILFVPNVYTEEGEVGKYGVGKFVKETWKKWLKF